MKRLALAASHRRGLIGCAITDKPLPQEDEIKAIEVELNRRYQVGDKSANLISILLRKILNVRRWQYASPFGQKLSQSDTVPATPDQADGNRGKKECDYLRHSA
jgi:hypothetical protein